MKKLLSCMALIMAMVTLAGCEWGSSGSDSSWSDSYSWVNFTGAYRPPSGKAYLVSSFGSDSSSGTTTTSNGVVIVYGTETISLGSGDGITDTLFTGTLNSPVTARSVTVVVGSWRLADSDGDGTLVSLDGSGSGSVTYNTGLISVSWLNPPDAGAEVFVTYTWVIDDGEGGGTDPGDSDDDNATKIYSLILTQTGQHLSALDNNGLEYSGVITGLSQSGGDRSGNTSGSIAANFSIKSDSGMQIVGVLTGTYVSPRDNGSQDGGEVSVGGMIGTGKDADGAEEAGVITTGYLANRQMQGTYISTSGSTGDVQAEVGGISVDVTN